MICTSCNFKEITSPNLTGELCTACYFESRENEAFGISRSSPTLQSSALEERLVNKPIPEIQEEIQNDNSQDIRTEEIGSGESGEDSKVIVGKSNNKEVAGVKYCQSCQERGYGLVIATREWTPDYFLCDDCFEPLLNNIISPTDESIKIIKENLPLVDSSKPILNQFYDLLSIPTELRYTRSDEILNHRNDIHNYHAPMVLNRTLEETKNFIEQLRSIVFTINVVLEPNTEYISRIKQSERLKNNVTSIEKGKKESGRSPSKVKQSQDQKTADTLFKLQMPFPDGHNNDCSCSICKEIRMKRLEKYLEFNKSVYDADRPRRIEEFEKKIK